MLLTGLTPYTLDSTGLVILMLINLMLVLTLAALIGWRLARLWATRRSGRAGAKLHVRLVAWFSAIAVVPAILVAVFAAVTLNVGMAAWFSSSVPHALDGSVNISRQYVQEQFDRIFIDAARNRRRHPARPLAARQSRQYPLGLMFAKLEIHDPRPRAGGIVPAGFPRHASGQLLQAQIYARTLTPSAADISDAQARADPVLGADADTGLVRALIHLGAMNDAYLLIVRVVDPAAFNYYRRNRGAVSEYHELEQNRQKLQIVFALLYGMVSLVVLLAAIWSGLWAANRLVRPISGLIDAAGRVSEGDLDAQVRVDRADDELANLAMAFNRMTHQLSAQRSDLVTANRLNEMRRRFTETVLSGVSAGVIGIDGEGRVTIVNRAAARLMDAAPEDLEACHYSEAVPELAPLILRAMSEPVGRAGGEVIIRRGGTPRTLSVQVTSERGSADSFVVTFDDITDLVSAQRTAAWADVARRIAHEIKNPLTPIQLSAERLKRKYAHEISTDPEVFQQCTDTIVRQVGDIGRMVDEFSSFARMPAPVMRRENAQELLQQAVFLQRVANPAITFSTDVPMAPVWFEGDGRLVAQALTNVLKNAGEGIAARIARGDDEPGKVAIALEPNGAQFCFRVTDNGIGLPPEHRHRLTEPYVTTRAKGTGLGLAIVRKIMEDHGGEIILADAESGEGAEVTLTFPLAQKSPKGSERGSEDEQKRIADRV